MGLKRQFVLKQVHEVESFNRTTVGLKLTQAVQLGFFFAAFNRTTVGLKLARLPTRFARASTFNRTTVGLKRI